MCHQHETAGTLGRFRRTLFVLLIGLWLRPVAGADTLSTLPLPAFEEELRGLRALTAACSAVAARCDVHHVPPPQRVTGASAGEFSIQFDWLTATLEAADKASGPDRADLMQEADAHLAAVALQATAPATSPQLSLKARRAAQSVLARSEFQTAERPGLISRLMARMQDAILDLFASVGRIGNRAPWLAPVVEWSCFGLAAAGLLWYVRRSLARQSLRIALSEAAMPARSGNRAADDWSRLARDFASAQNWREAVRCTYWAAIALLETRRAWKQNMARTPREYLRLLRPGSERQTALRDLTRTFESSWYGQRQSSEADYQEALQGFERLNAFKTERDPDSTSTAATLASAGQSG